MDSGTKIKKETNPRQNASLLSIALFFFTFPTIRKGVRKDLKESDIYEILSDYRSEKLGDRLEGLWKQELTKPKLSLVRTLIKMFGLLYCIIWVPVFTLETTELILQPILTGKVVSYFDPNTNMPLGDALWYAGGLIIIHMGFTFLDPTYFLMMEQICMKIRIACCSLLYKKCLKLNLNTSHQLASGRIVTLITKDMFQFETALLYVQNLFTGCIHIILASALMYYEIGVASLVGISLLVVILPLQVYLGKKVAELRLKTLENTDQRVRVTQEILTAIRIIKMYTWETFFSKSVDKLRKQEIKNLRCLFYLKAFALSLGQISSSVAFYACFVTYVALGNHITAEKAFVVIGCFESLSRVLATYMPTGIALIAELRTSLKRITDFLLMEELDVLENTVLENSDKPQVRIDGVTVTTEQNIIILEGLNVEIKSGLTVITGVVGAGKSTFLKVILGDVKKNKGIVKTAGKISYASQEPWLFPGTVKQNIIFGESFDAERYDRIVQVCALKKDFYDFPNGDSTGVTDKGLNISRGQKTRINLARAIYRHADIYLLDDCLSAVDTHVAKHIFFECFKGFLNSKICVLVTHQTQFFKEVDDIVILNHGRVKFHGSYTDLGSQSDELQFALDLSHQSVYVTESDQNKTIQDKGKAEEMEGVYTEIQEIGSIKKEVYYKLFVVNGGVLMIVMVLVISVIAQFTTSWSDYFVSFWVDTEQSMSGFRMNHTTHSEEYKELEESHDSMMKQYSFVVLIAVGLTFARAFSYFFFFSTISTNIHKTIMNKILKAGMLFFDKNLSGNILNRFSRDLGIIDEKMPFEVFDVTMKTLKLIAIFFVVTSVNLYFVVPSIIFALIMLIARGLYIPTGRSIRRLEGATRSPIIGHLNATLEGLTTIRASQAQGVLNSEFDDHQNHFNSVTFMHLVTTRAFGLYLSIAATLYISVITFSFLLMKTDSLAGQVGLAMTQSFALTGTLRFLIFHWAELENQMTSAERVLEYTKLTTDKTAKKRPENWPLNGKIEYKGVNLRYLPTSENVLTDINFVIEPKSKIGVVGRTGAGKSSIISVLFKLYDFQGTLTVDEVDINSVEVVLLRSKISIIPQDPVLFSGTVRSNLDPNQEYDDKEIWGALEEVEMKSLVETLDGPIIEGGSNYSIGQRQLLCLARAIVRKNVILVLDEATANVDPQTDQMIQNTIKRNFSNCTVITIAHRLNTIMDSDKVIVMDSGVVVEYDSPKVLLDDNNGSFYNMVKEAGLLNKNL